MGNGDLVGNMNTVGIGHFYLSLLTTGLGEQPAHQICLVSPYPTRYTMENPEVAEGIDIIESIWFLTAIKIVDLAIKIYNLDQDQAKALKDVFLKQNNYYVELT